MRHVAVCAAIALFAMAAHAGDDGWRLTGTVLAGQQSSLQLEREDGSQQRLHRGERLDQCIVRVISARGALLDCQQHARWRPIEHGLHNTTATARLRPAVAVLPAAAFRSLLSERQRLVNEITLKPRVHDGRTDGYEIARVKPGSVLEGRGLDAGDVIVAVNGTPVSQVYGLMNTLHQLDSAPDFLLQIERDGRLQDLQIQLR